jgi:HK97 gp10 family phage protein
MAIIGERELRRRLEQMLPSVRNAIEQGLVESALLVERDAKIKAPVDTGRLRSGLSHVTEDFGSNNPAITVGTNVEYAKFVEFGTSRQSAKPFLYPALIENEQKIKRKLAEAFRRGLGL